MLKTGSLVLDLALPFLPEIKTNCSNSKCQIAVGTAGPGATGPQQQVPDRVLPYLNSKCPIAVVSLEPQHTTYNQKHNRKHTATNTIANTQPEAQSQKNKPQNPRPWQHAPHHGMKTND